jgi:hypothetical protein
MTNRLPRGWGWRRQMRSGSEKAGSSVRTALNNHYLFVNNNVYIENVLVWKKVIVFTF